MNKEFVPYELADKLKNLGFDETCFGYWNIDPYLPNPTFNLVKPFDHEWCIPAPLYQQAFRWFREKYELVGVPTHQSYDIWNTITGECFIEIYPLNSYEEAELACLTKLIEIVEQQNQK